MTDLFKTESQRHVEDFKRFNEHQTNLESDLNHRLSQLDSAGVRITKLENLSEDIKNEIIDVKDYLNDLDNAKLNRVKFEERFLELYTDFRKTKIKADQVGDHAKTLENYCEKYIPLQVQNAISKTLHGYIGPTQKVRLEDYEVKVFADLHELILDDNGIPNLDQQREKIAEEINERLQYLQELYKERHLTMNDLANEKAADIDDSEIGSMKEEEEPKDEEDMVQMFKNQISSI